MYDRLIKHRIEEALEDTPVVLVVGPRRAGKTTLVQAIERGSRNYFTLDDPATLDAAIRSGWLGAATGTGDDR